MGDFAFVQGKIVHINQVVEANGKVSLYICKIVHEVNGSSKDIKIRVVRRQRRSPGGNHR